MENDGTLEYNIFPYECLYCDWSKARNVFFLLHYLLRFDMAVPYITQDPLLLLQRYERNMLAAIIHFHITSAARGIWTFSTPSTRGTKIYPHAFATLPESHQHAPHGQWRDFVTYFVTSTTSSARRLGVVLLLFWPYSLLTRGTPSKLYERCCRDCTMIRKIYLQL